MELTTLTKRWFIGGGGIIAYPVVFVNLAKGLFESDFEGFGQV